MTNSLFSRELSCYSIGNVCAEVAIGQISAQDTQPGPLLVDCTPEVVYPAPKTTCPQYFDPLGTPLSLEQQNFV